MRNKKLIWIVVILFLIVSSLAVTALRNPFSGLGARLSGGAGIVAIIVNTVIIALLLYLVLTLFKFIKLDNRTGKVIFIIVLILFSIYLSINLSKDPEGEYQFIWSKPIVSQAMDYLFNSGADGGAIGILRPSRILIFIGLTLLLSWFLIDMLDVGKGKHRIDYALATIIAMEATHAGLTKDMLIMLGQFLSTVLLYKQFKGDVKEFDWKSLVWAYGLVSVISNIVFPGQGLFIWRIVKFKTFKGLILTIIVLFGLGLIGGGLALLFRRKKKDEDKKANWAKNGGNYVWNDIRDYIRYFPIRWIRRLLNIRDWKDKTIEGNIPDLYIRLRVELDILMSYLMRLQVYKTKRKKAEDRRKKTEEMVKKLEAGTTQSACRAKVDAYQYKYGKKLIQYKYKKNEALIDEEEEKLRKLNLLESGDKLIERKRENSTMWVPVVREVTALQEDGSIHEKKHTDWGWATSKYMIHMLMNHLKKDLEDIETLRKGRTYHEGSVTKRKEIEDFPDVSKMQKEMVKNYKKYCNLNKYYGTFVARDSLRWVTLDQDIIHGWYRHPYKFARAYAHIHKVPFKGFFKDPFIIGENNKLKRIGVISGIPDETTETKELIKVHGPRFGAGAELFEVDYKGRLMDPLNDMLLTGKQKEIIQIPPELMYDHTSLPEILSKVDAVWSFFIRDLVMGAWHPYSKSAIDYIRCHQDKNYVYDKEGAKGFKKQTWPSTDEPAFDREALKDPGNFQFRGVTDYLKEIEKNLTEEGIINNYPAISIQGLINYINSLAEAQVADITREDIQEVSKAFGLKK